MVHGNVVNKFHDNNGLSDSGSSEESNLSSLGVRGQKINNLDTSNKNLLGLTLLSESRGRPVKGSELLSSLLGEDGPLLIDRLSNHIDNTSKSFGTDRHLDRGTGINTLLTTDKSVGGLHSNGTDGVLSQVLGDLKNETLAFGFNLKSIENLGKFLIELNINNGSNNRGDSSSALSSNGGSAEGTVSAQLSNTSSSKHGLSL
mmetsp:Transcript_27523/g.44762  ORF Transcript_27523/g.44762 Transcript_27523/m.44762 type:complete len:202 (-) Transcript_27523:39-644(-)